MDNAIDLTRLQGLGRFTPDAAQRARTVRAIFFDVDGVLTDGSIWYVPTGAEGALVEVKAFSAHDGIGIVLARVAGLRTGVITKRSSKSLTQRASDLRMDFIHQGIDNKLECLERILRENGLRRDEVACMGDDVVDLPMLLAGGLAAAPANARPELLAAAHFVATHAGGQGAARDLIDFILHAQGAFDNVVHNKYLKAPEPDRGPSAEKA